jgi:hypothetical protein
MAFANFECTECLEWRYDAADMSEAFISATLDPHAYLAAWLRCWSRQRARGSSQPIPKGRGQQDVRLIVGGLYSDIALRSTRAASLHGEDWTWPTNSDPCVSVKFEWNLKWRVCFHKGSSFFHRVQDCPHTIYALGVLLYIEYTAIRTFWPQWPRIPELATTASCRGPRRRAPQG